MKTLDYVVAFVVLFVLVLFGSVVPAAAQGGQDPSVVVPFSWMIGILICILVPTFGFIGGLYWKLDGVRKELDAKIDKKVDGATTTLKQDSSNAHGRIEGNIKAAEERITGSVATDVDRLYKLINDSEERITGSVKTDVDRLYNLMTQKKDKNP